MNAISHGHAEVTAEEARERARALVPRLRERAAAADAAGTLQAETLRDLHASGLLRALQPRHWGGMELDFVTYVDVPLELARGCASASWNVSNLMIHHWMLAMFDPRAQEEVWGENPDALIAAAIAYPQGHARRVAGGLVIGGRWNFSSGVDTAEWNLLAVTVRAGENVVDHRLCLVHRSQYEVIDDWRVLGMRATASMTVATEDLFVPEHRALCAYDIRGGSDFPGARLHSNALYRIPLSALAAHGIGGTAAGNAYAALEHTRARFAGDPGNRESSLVQLRVSAAAGAVDIARLVLRNDCIEAQAIAASGAAPDAQTKLRFKRNLAYAGTLCTQAVDALHALAGVEGLFESHPLERIVRDAHALGGHIMLNFDTWASAWGLVALGGTVANPTL